MQRHDLAEIAHSVHVPKAAEMGPDHALVQAIQTARGEEACFLTEKRWQCKVKRCVWRSDCRRLVAAWKR